MGDMTVQLDVGWVADDSTFGARLALVRQKMQWGNVKEAAVACHIPPETWRTWERDNRIPRDQVEQCRKIASVTNCSYRWLIDGPEPSIEVRRQGLEPRTRWLCAIPSDQVLPFPRESEEIDQAA